MIRFGGTPRRPRILQRASRFTESNALYRSTSAASSPYRNSRLCSVRTRRARIRSIIDLFGVKPDRLLWTLVLKQMVATPYQKLSEQRPCLALRAASPLGSCCSLGDHPSLSREDNKAPLPISWDDACVPGRAQNCIRRHEYSISTSFEKFSMDATDPRSFTTFQPVHRSLCFHN